MDIDAAVDSASKRDTGVPHGVALLRFATAAQTESDDLDDARAGLMAAVGENGVLEAAATVAVFNGLVRVADGTGIQLDDGVLADSADYRDRLGVNTYGGAANSEGIGPVGPNFIGGGTVRLSGRRHRSTAGCRPRACRTPLPLTVFSVS